MIINKFVKGLLASLGFLLPGMAMSEQFAIVIIPDTQGYAENNPEIFEAQMQWIVDNRTAENIIYVSHLGDMKDDNTCDNKVITAGTGAGRTEWQIVDDTLGMLETANIPYGVLPGNHDFDTLGTNCPNFTTQRPLSLFNTTLGPSRFAGQPYYGDPSVPTPGNRVALSNEDNFTLFGFCGVEFIAINLAYRGVANAVGSDPEVTWANNLLQTYPNRLGIVTTHYFMDQNDEVGTGGGSFNQFEDYGQEVYDGLSGNPNLFMMLSAHRRGEAWLQQNRAGMAPVQSILADYQSVMYPTAPIDYGNLNGNPANVGDSGFMRIMRFDTDTGMVNVETFIPTVPFLGRTSTVASVNPGTINQHLVSTYFPADGTGMDKDTASNISFSFAGYVAGGIQCTSGALVSCGIDSTGGDLLSRGFYHPSYPGSTLDSVELSISSRAAGSFGVRLDARLNSYNGALIASNQQVRALSSNDEANVSYLFDMGGAAVTPGSTIAFVLTQVTGTQTTEELFYAVDADEHPFGNDPDSSCAVIQTNGTSPPLDTLRREGLWLRINGLP